MEEVQLHLSLVAVGMAAQQPVAVLVDTLAEAPVAAAEQVSEPAVVLSAAVAVAL